MGLTVRFTLVALVRVTAQRLSIVSVTSLGLNALIVPSTTLTPYVSLAPDCAMVTGL